MSPEALSAARPDVREPSSDRIDGARTRGPEPDGPRRQPRPAALRAPGGLTTRRRLALAFGALAVAFAAAFGSLLVGLARMDEQLAYLHEHEHQMQVVLDIEAGIRGQYSPAAQPDGARAPDADARRRIFEQIAWLTERVDEPEAIVWIADLAAAARELDRPFREQASGSPSAGTPAAAGSAGVHRLLFEIEENGDRFFGFLRDRVVEQSGTVGALQRRTLRLAVGWVTGTLLLAAVLAIYLSRSVARPLAVLGAGAARIGSGDLATRIELESSDEFGALASEFNDMARALRQHQERLVRSEKLAGLGRVAAGIAHELNNPLQVMLGYLSLDRGRVKGAVAQHLERVEREALRCRDIVEALLQLSRPAVAFIAQAVDVREVAQDVAESVRCELGAGVPEIVIRGEGAALGTPCRIRQVLFNLVRNAADATGPAGTVRVDVRAVRGSVEIAVSDTGPGIPPELRDQIFEPFFTTKSHGTGLGLAIARAITASLGGDLELDRSERGGARFTVRVPSASAAA